ncbi:hypothetical protein [Geminisphaera colitermitum]|nr:hypothetical protein [Geminisphaera colitermitum]
MISKWKIEIMLLSGSPMPGKNYRLRLPENDTSPVRSLFSDATIAILMS